MDDRRVGAHRDVSLRRFTMLMIALLWALPLSAQEFGARLGTVKRGGQVTYEPQGPGVLFDALDPAVKKWHVPQELYNEYRWKQWEYSNYARENYHRYVSTALEGDYFYDVYGNFLTRGWLVYDWQQEDLQPFGNSMLKTDQYKSWFNSLVIASDHKGQHHYAITVGDQIRTTLTPMTFSKPLFNGLQIDYASDKYQATVLMSRISAPNARFAATGAGAVGRSEARTNNTNLFGGRFVAQVGEFARVGGTLVNAHHSQTQLQSINGDIFKGQLTEAQNFTPVTVVEVRIRDDSPEDGRGGGALFASDILIDDLEGKVTRGNEIGFRPLLEGGLQKQGFLAADGLEEIRVRYDFSDPSYIGPDPTEIVRVQLELVVANDYLIEIASDRQVNADDQVVFLPVAQARGNVRDGSNQRVLRFDYGLPTANQLAGFSVELTGLAGFEGYAEVDLNNRYRQYPNPNRTRHHTSGDQSLAWLFNLSQTRYPFFGFIEGFSVDSRYTSAVVTADEEGVLDYGNEFEIYEFVEDNDDQDRIPDWRRKGSGAAGDEEIFPGWDENNDFISDFNQNDNEDSPNLIPDYEEPFLRYYADRPEFLYGVDMNHNQWTDRFENDEEADLPYQRDREGYNAYAGAFLGPKIRVVMGRLAARRLAADEQNRAHYALLMLDQDHPRWGRLRIFEDLRKVRDNIADDLVQWEQPPGVRGTLRRVNDVLPAQDTWINTSWIGLDHELLPGLSLGHKFKWQVYRQLGERLDLELRGLRRTASFLGLIDKAEYRITRGPLVLMPRWKSEFLRQRSAVSSEAGRLELTELLMLVLRFPLMHSSFMETGLEYEIFSQLRDPTPPGARDSSRGLTSTVQLTNLSAYQGYRLTTTMGFELTRTSFTGRASEITTRSFITIYAGVEK